MQYTAYFPELWDDWHRPSTDRQPVYDSLVIDIGALAVHLCGGRPLADIYDLDAVVAIELESCPATGGTDTLSVVVHLCSAAAGVGNFQQRVNAIRCSPLFNSTEYDGKVVRYDRRDLTGAEQLP